MAVATSNACSEKLLREKSESFRRIPRREFRRSLEGAPVKEGEKWERAKPSHLFNGAREKHMPRLQREREGRGQRCAESTHCELLQGRLVLRPSADGRSEAVECTSGSW